MLLPADQIQPYVDLITWPIVALLGGAFFMPAMYVLVGRINEVEAFGVKGKLKQREANAIAQDAEEEIETEIEAGVSPSQILAQATDEGAETQRERFKAAMAVWSAAAYIIRDLAVADGGAALPHANQSREQITYLRERGTITRAQADRAIELLDIRSHWRAHSTRPIERDQFSSFQRRTRILGTQLNQRLQALTPPPAHRPSGSAGEWKQ